MDVQRADLVHARLEASSFAESYLGRTNNGRTAAVIQLELNGLDAIAFARILQESRFCACETGYRLIWIADSNKLHPGVQTETEYDPANIELREVAEVL